MTRSPSEDGFVDRLSGFSFLPPCYPSYRALAFALVRLFLTEYASLPWTHQHAGLTRRSLVNAANRTCAVRCDVFKHLGSYRNATLVYVAWSLGHDPVRPS